MHEKILWIVNFSLIMVIVLLVVHMAGVQFPSVGKVRALLDGEDPACFVQYKSDVSVLNMGLCCRVASQQLDCARRNSINLGVRTDYVCSTGRGDVAFYLLNAKAYNACSEVGRMP